MPSLDAQLVTFSLSDVGCHVYITIFPEKADLHTAACQLLSLQSAMADLVDSMLDLMRRLPPTRTEENVTALISICPDYADDLLGSVDQPLKLKTDHATGREYLICDYNRDGESYR
jgi:F-actin capping protein, beta subunit